MSSENAQRKEENEKTKNAQSKYPNDPTHLPSNLPFQSLTDIPRSVRLLHRVILSQSLSNARLPRCMTGMLCLSWVSETGSYDLVRPGTATLASATE